MLCVLQGWGPRHLWGSCTRYELSDWQQGGVRAAVANWPRQLPPLPTLLPSQVQHPLSSSFSGTGPLKVP